MQRVKGWLCPDCKVVWYSGMALEAGLVVYCPICGKPLELLPAVFKLDDAPAPRNTTIMIDQLTHQILKQMSKDTGKSMGNLVLGMSRNIDIKTLRSNTTL